MDIMRRFHPVDWIVLYMMILRQMVQPFYHLYLIILRSELKISLQIFHGNWVAKEIFHR